MALQNMFNEPIVSKNVLCPNEMHKPDNINLKIVNKQTKNVLT